MAIKIFRFITGQNTRNGLPGFLNTMVRGYGVATVASGQTTIAVTDTDIAATDIVVAWPITKGTNACAYAGFTASAGVSFTLSVTTDPGSGGCVMFYVVFRPPQAV